MARRSLILLLGLTMALFLTRGMATADSPDARGWARGVIAANAVALDDIARDRADAR